MARKFEISAKERIRKGLPKFVEILEQAAKRGVSEEDTSTITQAILVDLLGYDRFQEITGQFAARGRWADWAIKVGESLYYFVEVKTLGAKLREKDLFQVVSYSRQYSLEWAVLTTGDVWQCHRLAEGQEPQQLFEIRLLDSGQSIEEKLNWLFLLTKEGFGRGLLREHWARAECFRPERLAQLLVSDDVLGGLRRALRKENPGRSIEINDIRTALVRGVIRGDLQGTLEQDGKPRSSRLRTRRSSPSEAAGIGISPASQEQSEALGTRV